MSDKTNPSDLYDEEFLKKKEEFLLSIPLLVLIFGLWLGTPVYSEFRYAYPMFVAMPLILAVTLFAPDTPKT